MDRNGFAAADFNRDGQIDLAVSSPNDFTIRIIDGNTIGFTGRRAPFDFDGDCRTDVCVSRVVDGRIYWYWLSSVSGVFHQTVAGASGDFVVPGDFDGDHTDDIAVFRPSTGTWYTSTNPAKNYGAQQWGQSGDVPLVGDFDGDSKTDLAVYRAGVWYVRQSTDGSLASRQFGLSTDRPIAASP